MSEHERGMSEHERTIDLSVEVVGTPEEVWAAIATGAGESAAWRSARSTTPPPTRRSSSS
jgi:hypothetical protein